jgi:parvulin-like peptidyl-prolyl isomerase
MPTRKTATKTTKSVKTTAAKTSANVSAKGERDEIILPEERQEKKSKALRIKKSYLFTILLFILIGVFVYVYRALFVAVVVNGQPIARWTVVREAEKQSGSQALNTLIRNTIIQQEAKRQNITVSDKEIDDEIKKVESNLSKQKQNLDAVLKMQNMTRADLRSLIRLDKLVQKMVGKDIKISDKEVDDYIQKNKEMMPANQNEKELKASVKDRLKQQQLQQKVQTWLQDLQSKAKITQFVQY